MNTANAVALLLALALAGADGEAVAGEAVLGAGRALPREAVS